MRILILGLDGAGKTTILYRLQVGEVVTTIPSECAGGPPFRLFASATSLSSSLWPAGGVRRARSLLSIAHVCPRRILSFLRTDAASVPPPPPLSNVPGPRTIHVRFQPAALLVTCYCQPMCGVDLRCCQSNQFWSSMLTCRPPVPTTTAAPPPAYWTHPVSPASLPIPAAAPARLPQRLGSTSRRSHTKT